MAQGWTRSMRSSTEASPAARTAAAERPFMSRAAARARLMKGTVSPNEL